MRTVADGKWVRRIARTAADSVGARESLEMGEEKKPLVMSVFGCADGCGRERLRTGNGCGELRGRLRTAWVRGSGWKWVGRRRAADGKWVGRIARTAVDGVGAREWLEMVGEKKPLGMDGCGRQMGGENCADGCGRRGCKGVAGNG